MTKAGRNAPCPCGSGKKYKKCCLNNTPNEIKNDFSMDFIPIELDIDILSNKANSLIHDKKWKEAKKTCEELLAKFPDQTDGLFRTVQLLEEQENYQDALLYAKKTLSFIRNNPETCSPEMIEDQKDEINRIKKKIYY
jgi:uncharacterized protein YecA (UPF0149 family)